MIEPKPTKRYVATPEGLYGLLLRYLQRDVDSGTLARLDALEELKTAGRHITREQIEAIEKGGK